MNKYLVLIVLIVFVIASFWSCNNETNIGGDVIGDADLNVQFTDDFDISTRPVVIDSVLSFEPENFETSNIYSPSVFLLGELNDPIFGRSTANIAMNIGVINLDTTFIFTDNNVLDSAVLVLKLDTLGYYGSEDGTINIKVKELAETLDDSEIKYSNSQVTVDDVIVGEINFQSSFDSVLVENAARDSFIMRSPEIRIKLSDEYMSKLFNTTRDIIADDPSNFSDDVFVDQIKGFYLEAESTENAVVGLSLGAAYSSTFNRFVTANPSSLDLFLTRADTLPLSYNYNIDGVRFNQYTQDYTSGTIQNYLDNDVDTDSLAFVQAMNGIDTEIDITDLVKLGDVILNNVQLELTIATLDGDDLAEQSPITSMYAYSYNEAGNQEFISDMVVASGTNIFLDASLLDDLFDGAVSEFVENGVVIQKYNFNITRFAQEYQRGENDGKLFLQSANKGQIARRSVLYGAEHSQFPAKMNVTYTSAN